MDDKLLLLLAVLQIVMPNPFGHVANQVLLCCSERLEMVGSQETLEAAVLVVVLERAEEVEWVGDIVVEEVVVPASVLLALHDWHI